MGGSQTSFSRDTVQPLTQAQFYSQYAQHVDIRNRSDRAKSDEVRSSVLMDGFKKGSNVNAVPPYRGGQPSNVIDKKYAPKNGDVVYLAPKGAWTDKPNGMEIQDGWIPKPYEVIRVSSDNPSMYEEYVKAFSQFQVDKHISKPS